MFALTLGQTVALLESSGPSDISAAQDAKVAERELSRAGEKTMENVEICFKL